MHGPFSKILGGRPPRPPRIDAPGYMGVSTDLANSSRATNRRANLSYFFPLLVHHSAIIRYYV